MTVPVIQAPMAGVDTPDMAVAVTQAGGLGSLACAMLSVDDIKAAWAQMRQNTDGAINLNFFCHVQRPDQQEQQTRWRNRLAPYYRELSLDANAVEPSATRAPFDTRLCTVVEEIKPEVISFHFGLPTPDLMARVKRTGAIVLSSATTVDEAIWLAERGCDVIIAQGAQAGGHRALFLSDDLTQQPNTFDLLTDIVARVDVPVVAAGGLADAADVQRALALGAVAAQVGTAYLFCPEARVSPLYKHALLRGGETVLTNVFSGRPARGIVNRFINEMGILSADAPDFPYASHFTNPLKAASEKNGSDDFMQMWSGTKRVPHNMNAYDLTRALGAR